MAATGVTIASLKATVGLDDSDLQRGLQRSSSAFEKFAGDAERTGRRVGEALSGWGSKLTVGLTLPLVGAGAAMIKFASDANESLNKVQVIFGQSAAGIEQWSKSAAMSMGMSARTAQEAAAGFGNMFRTMGQTQAQAADMSKTMVRLAADLGSMHNVGTDEALLKIRAGLVGEAEPLRTMGILLTEDAVKAQALKMGLGDAHGELTEGQKVMARYALILKQSGSAQGDFARTSDDFANKSKKASASIEELAASLGKELLPMAKDVLGVIIDLVKQFNALDPATKKAALGFGAVVAAAGPLLHAGGSAALIFGALRGGGAAAGGTAAAGAGAAGAGLALPVAAATAASAIWGNVVEGGLKGVGVPKDLAKFIGEAVSPAKMVLDALGGMAGKAFGGSGKKAGAAAAGGRPTPYTLPPELGGPQGKTSMSEIQDLQYEAQLQMARAGSAGGAEDQNAQAEARAQVPLLQGRITQLTARQKALEPKLKTSTDAAKEYYKITIDGWKLQEEITNLQQAATNEVKANQDKVITKQKEAYQKWMELQQKAASEQKQAQDSFKNAREQYWQAELDRTPDEEKAQRTLEMMVPHLEEVQNEALAAVRRLNPQTKEYWDAVKDFWEAEKQVQQLAANATKEQDTATKKAGEEMKKAAEAEKKAGQEQMQLVSAREKLAEEQIKNTVGATDEQKKKMLQPVLKAEYAGLLKPVAGESEVERVQRLTEAEAVKGRILEGAGLTGKGSMRRVLGGGQVFMGDRRQAQRTLGELAGIEREAKQGVTVQLQPPPQGYAVLGQLFQDPQFKKAMEQFVNQYLSGAVRQMMPAPGYR